MARIANLVTVMAVLALASSTTWAQSPPPSAPPNTAAVCALDGSSANIGISVNGNNRVIYTNMCPNHPIRTINPNAARHNEFFGITDMNWAVPLQPQLASTANIINVTCAPGPIGIMRSGAAMFSVFAAMGCPSNAVVGEAFTFDECNGHSENSGMYHYHMTPGCTLVSAGFNTSSHSPILGYLLDGIPMYGPLGDAGAQPTDLDECGGHASDSGNNGQYHYHTRPVTGTWPDPATPVTRDVAATLTGGYPYTAACLRGCVPDPYLHFFSSQGLAAYSSYADCQATGGTVLDNVEALTIVSDSSTTSGPSPGGNPPGGNAPPTSASSGLQWILATVAALVACVATL